MKIVTVKIGNDKFDALLNDNEITIQSYGVVIKDTINIDGSDVKVISKLHNTEDKIFKIKLANASPIKEKSDDKPTKRAD